MTTVALPATISFHPLGVGELIDSTAKRATMVD